MTTREATFKEFFADYLQRSWKTFIDESKDLIRIMGKLHTPHRGEILKEDFLNGIGMSQNQLAYFIGVLPNRIHAIVNGTRDITADTDIRLSLFFGLSDGYWLRLQNAFDLMGVRRKGRPFEKSNR